jgi:hypothetical protein
MNDLIIVALNKAVSAAAARKASAELTPGEHNVDCLVHVTGTLKRGEDYEQEIVAKADPWTLVAAALSHLNGVTVDSLVREALTADPELVKSLKREAATAVKAVKAPTLTACNGKVTVKLDVSVVSEAAAAVA